MNGKTVIPTAALLFTGLILQAGSFFLLPGIVPAVLPGFACIAALSSPGDYTRAALAGVLAGIMLIFFTTTSAEAAAAVLASIAGAVSCVAVQTEMIKNGEETFSSFVSIFSGTMIAGMIIMATGLTGVLHPGPVSLFGAFTALIVLSSLTGVLGQGILPLLKKSVED